MTETDRRHQKPIFDISLTLRVVTRHIYTYIYMHYILLRELHTYMIYAAKRFILDYQIPAKISMMLTSNHEPRCVLNIITNFIDRSLRSEGTSLVDFYPYMAMIAN